MHWDSNFNARGRLNMLTQNTAGFRLPRHVRSDKRNLDITFKVRYANDAAQTACHAAHTHMLGTNQPSAVHRFNPWSSS